MIPSSGASRTATRAGRGFRRFLDVMEATGQRPQPGSATAFNTEIQRGARRRHWHLRSTVHRGHLQLHGSQGLQRFEQVRQVPAGARRRDLRQGLGREVGLLLHQGPVMPIRANAGRPANDDLMPLLGRSSHSTMSSPCRRN
jgi:hypothetical protein